MTIMMNKRPSVAVVGAGISGLGAAWLLSRGAEVSLFEAQPRFGGHANTVDTPYGVPVDTGFIVYNEPAYPNLTGLFAQLGVETIATDMSFALSIDGGRYEYAASPRPRELFAVPSNFLRPRYWRMLADMRRFFADANALVEAGAGGDEPLGDFVVRKGYSSEFIEDHLLPMAAAIWSAPQREILAFPARSLALFYHNHRLLQFTDRVPWRTVKGGSRAYVRRMLADTPGQHHAESPVVAVRRDGARVAVHTANSVAGVFDQVVLACPGDRALALLDQPTNPEGTLLSAFRYARNDAYLHTDRRFLPRRPAVWSSWNVLKTSTDRTDRNVNVSYWMNRLQSLSTPEPLVVSLNPVTEPDPDRTIGHWAYQHPIMDTAAFNAKASLPSIQGTRGIWYCGAHLGYGFHEDGLSAGLAVAEAILAGTGIRRPWRTPDVSPAGLAVAAPALPLAA